MQIIARWALCLSVSAAVAAAAQQKNKTEAQTDGFEGPICTVSTHVEMAGLKWQQPAGPTLVWPIVCRDCEYDPDGSRTRSGLITEDGKFAGEEIKLTRDGLGHVVERTTVNVQDGTISLQEKVGPFGPVERTFYMNGKAQRVMLTYDRLGYLSELLTFDSQGNQTERDMTRTDANGQWTERAVWGKDGQLSYRETYDPETDFQHFEAYDDSGAVKVTFTFSQDKVQTFWAATDEPNQFGSSFTDNKGNGNFDAFSCHRGGECNVSHVHDTYADSAKRNPASVEWRNTEGTLLYAAYYEYEFDGQQNWTKRKVWVRSPEIPERTLYETDTRVISYWSK